MLRHAPLRRLVAAFRKWLDVRGGGGPPTRLKPEEPLPALEQRQEAFLDRYETHTRHCPACMGVRAGSKPVFRPAASPCTCDGWWRRILACHSHAMSHAHQC